LPNLLPSAPHQGGSFWLSRPRTATHTRPLASIATLRGSPLRVHVFGPQYGEGVGDALNGMFNGVASEGTFNVSDLLATGSSTVRMSVISEAPYTFPFALILALRVSEAALSERPSLGVPQSHSVMTRLRSTPVGRGGATLGASPFAMRSLQSANAERCGPIARKKLPMAGPEGPTLVRRSQA